MKQKIVITLSTIDNEKSRRKALKTAANQAGVDSAAIKGEERNQIEVIGERVDAAQLTIMIRKKVGYADLSSVVDLAGQNKNQATVPPGTSLPTGWSYGWHYYQNYKVLLQQQLQLPFGRYSQETASRSHITNVMYECVLAKLLHGSLFRVYLSFK